MTKLLGSTRDYSVAFIPTLSLSPLSQGAGSYAFIFILFGAEDSFLEA